MASKHEPQSADDRAASNLPLTFLPGGKEDGPFKGCSIQCEPNEALIQIDVGEPPRVEFTDCRVGSLTHIRPKSPECFAK